MVGDEAVPGRATRATAASGARRRLVELDQAEALALLAAAPYGRVVFTYQALPAIRTVNHVIDGGHIIIRTRLAAAITRSVTPVPPTVVAYQADNIDSAARLGWSVVATGLARPLTDPAEVSRVGRLLQPWVDLDMDVMLAIEPQIVTGYRLTPTD